ncbi:hypothetical protein Pelo_4786 [Pelomyxa schiedti]|nr:hypothetical protein Pelo_4786 [Pelomyxa schiedti]
MEDHEPIVRKDKRFSLSSVLCVIRAWSDGDVSVMGDQRPEPSSRLGDLDCDWSLGWVGPHTFPPSLKRSLGIKGVLKGKPSKLLLIVSVYRLLLDGRDGMKRSGVKQGSIVARRVPSWWNRDYVAITMLWNGASACTEADISNTEADISGMEVDISGTEAIISGTTSVHSAMRLVQQS